MNDQTNAETIIEKILNQSDTLVKAFVPGHGASLTDAREFVLSSSEDIANYYKLFANNEINQEGLESSVKGLVDLAELHKIKEAGLEAAQLDKLKEELVNIITSAIG